MISVAPSEDQLASVPLPRRLGAVLAAMAALTDPSASDLVDWLEHHPVGWVPKSNEPLAVHREAAKANAISKAVGDLRSRLAGQVPPGMPQYQLAKGSYAFGPLTVSLEQPGDPPAG